MHPPTLPPHPTHLATAAHRIIVAYLPLLRTSILHHDAMRTCPRQGRLHTPGFC